ncbi:MAG: C25 family cysteine peptidase [Planctomycetota bacterium]
MRRLPALLLAFLAAAGAVARAGEVRTVRVTSPGEGVLRLSAAELAAAGLDAESVHVYTGCRGAGYVRTGDGGIDVYSAPYTSLYDAERSFLISNRPLPYRGSSRPMKPRRFEGHRRFFRPDTPPPVQEGPDLYTETVHVEEDQFYLVGLTAARPGEDHWFYSTFLMPGSSLVLSPELPAPMAPGPGSITVALRGCTDVLQVSPDHRVTVEVNGRLVGEMLWNGYTRLEQSFELPEGILTEGANTVKLTGVAQEGVPFDFVCADWVEISYPRRLTAVDDRLHLAVDTGAGRRLTAGGFSGPDVVAMDVTDPARPRLLVLDVLAGEGDWSASWVTLAAGPRRYVLAGPGGRLATTGSRDSDPWDARRRGGHRYLLVTHADHLAAARRLEALHGGRHGRVRVYEAEYVYDAFACGQAGPHAIRSLARRHRPNYLCLLGDTSADMPGRLGDPGSGLIPSFLIQGPHFQEASDNPFGCIAGDDERPDVAVGRLPARTLAEAEVMVDKIEARMGLGAARATAYGGTQAALVVGDDDLAIFEDGAAEYASAFSWGGVTKILFSDYGTAAETRAAIVSGWDNDPRYFVYFGHAATDYLGKEKVLRSADVPALTAPQLPAGIALCCLAGYFNSHSGSDSLAERLIKEPDRGVCMLVAPAGMSPPEGQLLLGRKLAAIIAADRGVPLGRALMRAKRGMPKHHRDVLRSFNLLGDPKLR